VGKEKFQMRKGAARMSNLIKTILDQDKTCLHISLKELSPDIFLVMFDFMNIYYDSKENSWFPIPRPVPKDFFEKTAPPWVAKFVNLSVPQIRPLVTCANYLDIQPLLHLYCARIGLMITGKSLAQIRKILEDPLC
jgi:hypothetical protein